MTTLTHTQNAALHILKQHETGIRIRDLPGVLHVDFRVPDEAALHEVTSALGAFFPLLGREKDIGIFQEQNQVRLSSWKEQQRLRDFAKSLADHGINFPGSEKFHSKTP